MPILCVNLQRLMELCGNLCQRCGEHLKEPFGKGLNLKFIVVNEDISGKATG